MGDVLEFHSKQTAKAGDRRSTTTIQALKTIIKAEQAGQPLPPLQLRGRTLKLLYRLGYIAFFHRPGFGCRLCISPLGRSALQQSKVDDV